MGLRLGHLADQGDRVLDVGAQLSQAGLDLLHALGHGGRVCPDRGDSLLELGRELVHVVQHELGPEVDCGMSREVALPHDPDHHLRAFVEHHLAELSAQDMRGEALGQHGNIRDHVALHHDGRRGQLLDVGPQEGDQSRGAVVAGQFRHLGQDLVQALYLLHQLGPVAPHLLHGLVHLREQGGLGVDPEVGPQQDAGRERVLAAPHDGDGAAARAEGDAVDVARQEGGLERVGHFLRARHEHPLGELVDVVLPALLSRRAPAVEVGDVLDVAIPEVVLRPDLAGAVEQLVGQDVVAVHADVGDRADGEEESLPVLGDLVHEVGPHREDEVRPRVGTVERAVEVRGGLVVQARLRGFGPGVVVRGHRGLLSGTVSRGDYYGIL